MRTKTEIKKWLLEVKEHRAKLETAASNATDNMSFLQLDEERRRYQTIEDVLESVLR